MIFQGILTFSSGSALNLFSETHDVHESIRQVELEQSIHFSLLTFLTLVLSTGHTVYIPVSPSKISILRNTRGNGALNMVHIIS